MPGPAPASSVTAPVRGTDGPHLRPASAPGDTLPSPLTRASALVSTEPSVPVSATLLSGDGIGPGIVEATVVGLAGLGAPFALETAQAGPAGLHASGNAHAVAIPTGVDTRQRSRNVLRLAFEYAIRNGRRNVTIVRRVAHKLVRRVAHGAGIVPALTGISRDAARPHPCGRCAARYRVMPGCRGFGPQSPARRPPGCILAETLHNTGP